MTTSEPNGRESFSLIRDDLEGGYTQKDPTVGHVRTVHGQYTESDGHLVPDPRVEGTYVGATRDGVGPLVRPSQLRHGNYPKAEHTSESAAHRREHRTGH